MFCSLPVPVINFLPFQYMLCDNGQNSFMSSLPYTEQAVGISLYSEGHCRRNGLRLWLVVCPSHKPRIQLLSELRFPVWLGESHLPMKVLDMPSPPSTVTPLLPLCTHLPAALLMHLAPEDCFLFSQQLGTSPGGGNPVSLSAIQML